ncbi:hypothetical protein M2368_003437 [Arthrobacter sp. JUb119]|uniref:hypothetical protein n=1 Tax=Arthrobacter sp. JUb115 TaxID=2485108 RepID=UPI00105F7286|nr:hypothetical protein [Arthrobacter sp. JUb115]MCS3494405.1 hypothetical protein [Arthrobacter sp. JUb119]TDU22498.1 hypothetical protein EDF61_10928 [Arthrobacter sp. JUb115]
MTIQKKAQEFTQTIVEDVKGAESIAGRVLSYQRQKAKRQQRGLPAPSAIEHENLRTAISYHFGEPTALFFDRYERLPYDRQSLLGWPMTWAGRQAINSWLLIITGTLWVLFYFYLRRILDFKELGSPEKYFAHAAVTGLCAVLLLFVLTQLIRQFPPKNLEQRLLDYEGMKQRRIADTQARETAAEQERIDRIGKAKEREINAEQARAERLIQDSRKESQ